MTGPRDVLRRGRRLARRATRPVSRAARPVGRAGRRLDRAARRLVPQPVRKRLYRVLPWRPWRVRVELDRIQLGVMGPQTAAQFAEATGDLLWPSTRLVDGPHVELLRLVQQADAEGRELTDDEVLASRYGRMALACLEHHGRYFWATDEKGVLEVARDFADRLRGAPRRAPRAHQSAPGSPILLAPIRWSRQYQVVDGHHRLALAWIRGERTVEAKVKWLPVTTPLQDLLLRMSWIGGERELYQPVDAPELRDGWTTVRRCTDRLEKMLAFLAERGIEGGTYLDVACCYGWFPARMAEAGFEVSGIERDPLSRPLARAVYGLDPERIRVGDAEVLLEQVEQPYDVVSCFSLLHHFTLGRASVSDAELVRRLDRATGRVLFLDTGQEDEAWFAESLRGWTPERIAAFLREHTTFDEVVDLGPDADRVPPYQDNYGRHLFACVRH